MAKVERSGLGLSGTSCKLYKELHKGNEALLRTEAKDKEKIQITVEKPKEEPAKRLTRSGTGKLYRLLSTGGEKQASADDLLQQIVKNESLKVFPVTRANSDTNISLDDKEDNYKLYRQLSKGAQVILDVASQGGCGLQQGDTDHLPYDLPADPSSQTCQARKEQRKKLEKKFLVSPRNYKEDGSSIVWKDTVSEALLSDLTNKEIKAQNLIYEMLATEEQYLQDLRILIEVYVEPLREQGILNKKQSGIIFSNIEAIYDINLSILSELKKRKKSNGVVEGVGEVFLTKVDLLKVYAVYCSMQFVRIQKIKKYKQKNEDFREFLEKAFQNSRCRLLAIDSFLIQPLQKICRYPLFLEGLIKTTEEGTEEHIKLTQALEKLKGIIDLVNERTRQVENVTQVVAIQKNLLTFQQFELATRERYLISEDSVIRTNTKGEKSKNYHIFLFNDLFLICTPKLVKSQKKQQTVEKQQLLEKLALSDFVARKFNSHATFEDLHHSKDDESWGGTLRRKRKASFTALHTSINTFGGTLSRAIELPITHHTIRRRETISGDKPKFLEEFVENQVDEQKIFEIVIKKRGKVPSKIYQFKVSSEVAASKWVLNIQKAACDLGCSSSPPP
eukprot:CAMPEP_0174273892 /NCGR_PEP_ID=MMETSP0439-20130205/56155_1 /TAXON_ID=0 /ORGANISM="Stereomyxa ramosa, Strain Chinc5" /LENGTH=617 /DNA_ID=CAMNT_0015365353 /DNA_START=217 /DNA_END=2070 /DNA_ORIENTATION=+